VRQLSSLDAQFLALETPRQSGHVGSVAILDPSTRPTGTLALSDIQALIVERLPLLPPLQWRIQEVPLGLDYPYWIDDRDFDLDFHVRELALAAPGADVQLAEQVARIVARPLDRSRPLWELYLISGLASGHVAMLTKIHHALVDGLSGAEIMGLLLDLAPTGRELPAPEESRNDESAPGQLGMLARGLRGIPRYPLRALRSLPAAVPNLQETPFGALPGASAFGAVAKRVERAITGAEPPVHARERLVAPKTSFNGRVSAHRRFAFGQLKLDEVKAVKNAHSCTVNDVVVSICAAAVRRWLITHDELPDEPLVAQIPVSVRTDEQAGTYGNRIILMSAPLFTDEPDPLRRLMRTHGSLDGMKERHRALPAGLLQDANNFIPPAVFSRAARLTFRLATSGPGRPTWNLVISNVPGPPVPLYCAGARLVANYPVSVITDGMGLNITVMSYCGNLDFGIVADREQMPDVNKLISWLGDALEELKPQAAMK
jgi:diacylglycerol O-acyltransferase / wax synthase